MSNIRWEIIITPKEKLDYHRLVSLEVPIAYEPLHSLFSVAPELKYLSIINSAIHGHGRGFDGPTGVTFPDDLDDYDKETHGEIPPDMVEIYDPLMTVQVPRDDFLEVLLEMSEALLKVMRERGKAEPEWEKDMEEAIGKLRPMVK